MIRTYLGHAPVIPASCYVDVSAQILGDVTLGEQTSVWMNAVLRGDVHSIRLGANSNVQGCVIEDACLIGMGAVILNGARIGEGSIIAAGALIPEGVIVPPRTLWAGLPAKQRRELGDKDREQILMYARNYLDYTATYLEERKQWKGAAE